MSKYIDAESVIDRIVEFANLELSRAPKAQTGAIMRGVMDYLDSSLIAAIQAKEDVTTVTGKAQANALRAKMETFLVGKNRNESTGSEISPRTQAIDKHRRQCPHGPKVR